MSTLKLAFALAGLLASAALPAQPRDDTAFLEFPMATDVSTAEIPAFAWLVRQGENSTLMFARAPDFKPVRLFARHDVDGQPITGIATSPDGRFVAFQTGAPFGGSGDGFNPAGLIETPKVTSRPTASGCSIARDAISGRSTLPTRQRNPPCWCPAAPGSVRRCGPATAGR